MGASPQPSFNQTALTPELLSRKHWQAQLDLGLLILKLQV